MPIKVFYICKFHEYCDALRENNECHYTSCSKARKHANVLDMEFKEDVYGNFWEIENLETDIS